MGSVTCISWKSDLIVRGDSEGNINIYNVKTRECKNSNTGRGCVKKIRFSPGKNNLKMLVRRTLIRQNLRFSILVVGALH